METLADRLVDKILADDPRSDAPAVLRELFQWHWFCERARQEGRLNTKRVRDTLHRFDMDLKITCPEALVEEPTGEELARAARRLLDHLLHDPEPVHLAAFALQTYADEQKLDDVIEIVERRMSDLRWVSVVEGCLYNIAYHHSDDTENKAIAFLERVRAEAASPDVRELAEERLEALRK